MAVFGADHIYRMDVRQMIDFHLRNDADVTVASLPVPVERASSFGVVRVDDNQRSDEKIPAGRIMQQDPPAGSRARRQRTVRVWVSSGAAQRKPTFQPVRPNILPAEPIFTVRSRIPG